MERISGSQIQDIGATCSLGNILALFGGIEQKLPFHSLPTQSELQGRFRAAVEEHNARPDVSWTAALG